MFKRNSLPNVVGLKCMKCGKEYKIDEVIYLCPEHGDKGILDFIYDYDEIKKRLTKKELANSKEATIWRYLPLLPLPQHSLPEFILKVGFTPLYRFKALEEELNVRRFYIKDDTKNPTASLKDRASAVAIMEALYYGEKIITAASTGNAASSLAGLSAPMGIKTVIFVPESAPKAKIAQLLVFGAKLFAVKGNYDQAFELCMEVSKHFGWYLRNTAVNPILSEGKKTVALEICEGLNWEVPDRVYVPVGDGCIIGGVYKGFYDLKELGFIEKIPKIIGVQAEGSQALALAWKENKGEVTPIKASTIADSISVDMPRDPDKALRAVQNSKGKFITVSDKEILEAIKYLGTKTGIFVEPASSAAMAGFLKDLRENNLSKDESIVILATGNGLKDVDSAIKAVGSPVTISPELEAFKKAFHSMSL